MTVLTQRPGLYVIVWDEALRLLYDDCSHHVLMNIADVAVGARLCRSLEGLGLILGDVAGIELPTSGSQRVGGAVRVGYGHGGARLDVHAHGVKHEIRDRYVDTRRSSGARAARRPRCTRRAHFSATARSKQNRSRQHRGDTCRKEGSEDAAVLCHGCRPDET